MLGNGLNKICRAAAPGSEGAGEPGGDPLCSYGASGLHRETRQITLCLSQDKAG